jgi:hypothetical protein
MWPAGWDALGQWGDDVVIGERLTGGAGVNGVRSVRVSGHLAVGRLGQRSDADLAWETGLLRHLHREGMPVPAPVPTTDGRHFADGLVVMTSDIGKIAEAPSGDKDAWAEEDDEGSGEVLGKYAWELSDEDGPEGGSIWMATQTVGGRRIALMAVLDVYVSFIAEAQTGGPPWKLEKQWDHTEWARPRMPRTAGYLNELTTRSSLITTAAADPGELNAP